MRPTAVHKIKELTSNVTPALEGEVWNKQLRQCMKLELKVARCHATTLLSFYLVNLEIRIKVRMT